MHRRPDSFSSFTTNPHTSQPTAGYLRLSQAMRCIHIYIFWNNRATWTNKNYSLPRRRSPDTKCSVSIPILFSMFPSVKIYFGKGQYLYQACPIRPISPTTNIAETSFQPLPLVGFSTFKKGEFWPNPNISHHSF